MKVALVNSSYTRVANAPPLGLLSIASILVSNGYDVRIYDIFPGNMREKTKEIGKFHPEIIAVSILSFQVQSSKKITDVLRKTLKKTLFVGGGVHVSALPEYSLRNFGLDCCVVGEGEMTFLELCERISLDEDWRKIDGIAYLRNGKFFLNKPRELIQDLDFLPFPARYLLPMEKYLLPGGTVRGVWLDRTTTVMTSRGCPGRCIFCSSKLLFGRRTRRRSIDNVIDEISMLKYKYRITGIYFMDDTFTIKRKWVIEFCEKLIQSELDIKWACQSRVDTVDEEMLLLMKKAGLVQIEFGIESGSESVLKIIKKDANLDKVRKTLSAARNLGIRTLVTFILGIPGEEKDDILETIRLAREIKADHCEFYFAEPFPGTELLSLARDKNLLLPETVPEEGLYPNAISLDFRKIKPSMRSNLDPDELMRIREKIHREFPRFTVGERISNLQHVFSLLLKNPKIIFGSTMDYLRKPQDFKLHIISCLERKIRDEIH